MRRRRGGGGGGVRSRRMKIRRWREKKKVENNKKKMTDLPKKRFKPTNTETWIRAVESLYLACNNHSCFSSVFCFFLSLILVSVADTQWLECRSGTFLFCRIRWCSWHASPGHALLACTAATTQKGTYGSRKESNFNFLLKNYIYIYRWWNPRRRSEIPGPF